MIDANSAAAGPNSEENLIVQTATTEMELMSPMIQICDVLVCHLEKLEVTLSAGEIRDATDWKVPIGTGAIAELFLLAWIVEKCR